ncbi:MAG: transposase, partial [Nocardioides sp.]
MKSVWRDKRVRKQSRKRVGKRVKVGAPDPRLTRFSGLAAIAEFCDKLDVVGTLDRGIGPIKQRARGASAGELVVAIAQSQLLGGDALVALDRQRLDVGVADLGAVPPIPATTAASLARRFDEVQLAGIESGNAEVIARAVALLGQARQSELASRLTIDMDSTDVEVYGSRKQGVAYNYAGQRAGRPHLGTWAEAGLTVAADLLAGNADVRPRAADMLGRALASVPEPVLTTLGQAGSVPRVRADAGYFTGDLARAAVEAGCDFAIATERSTAMWRAYSSIAGHAWVDALGMPGAQVAAVDYAPAGWPQHTYTIVRRVRVQAEAISADARSRRRRTIDPDQLALALAGNAAHVYAVSFIVTNIPANDTDRQADHVSRGTGGHGPTVVDVEAWFRRRTDIEDRIREAKLGAALRHLPSGSATVNTVWMGAALLAGNLSVLLQALTRINQGGRAHAARLRHELL